MITLALEVAKHGAMGLRVVDAMRIAAAIVLAMAVYPIVSCTSASQSKLPAQEAKPSGRPATLAQQKMCDEQANKKFTESSASDPDAAGEFTSHYDPNTNVCYILVHGGMSKQMNGYAYLIYDAFEGRTYGNFVWTLRENKLEPNPPAMCSIAPLGQQQIHCNSEEEFQAFAEKYFGIGFP